MKETGKTYEEWFAGLEGTGDAIIDRLTNDTSLGLSKGKKEAMIDIATSLLNEGYDSAFVAGVLSNI
jgi:hypothetical protein